MPPDHDRGHGLLRLAPGLAVALGIGSLVLGWQALAFLASKNYVSAIACLVSSVGLGHVTSRIVEALVAWRLQ